MIRYFNNSHVGLGGGRVEEHAAKEARSQINPLIAEIHSIIRSSGVNPVLPWTPPANLGDRAIEVDLIKNIFNLDQFNIGPSNLLAFIDRAIGIYESNRKSALVRTCNPFFYIGRALDTISDLPFIVIGILGFNRQKIRASKIGKLVKGVLYLIIVVAVLIAILYLLDLLEPIKQSVADLFDLSKPFDFDGNSNLPQ